MESRLVEGGEVIRRRRECLSCSKRFTTFEKVRTAVVRVIKKDGRRETFDREKVRRGIIRAVEKRPVSSEELDLVVEEVERQVLSQEKEEVSTKLIGNLVLKKLKKLDKVAWLRFASVYLEFEDVTDFEKAIEKVQ